MPSAYLPDRGVVRITGPEAGAFLDRLLTADIAALAPGRATLAALLSPQGKILVDMLVAAVPEEEDGGYLIDCPRGLAADLAAKLVLYRLRAKVTIADLSDVLGVAAVWDGPAPEDLDAFAYADPRLEGAGLEGLGLRLIAPREALTGLGEADAYHARRIALGVPEGGKDYAYADAFPHEALLDQLGGVSFTKGCYVGQEVVSRMEHRNAARTRVVPLVFPDGVVASEGLEIVVGGRGLGRMGSGVNGRGLALLRLDRVADAMAAGEPLNAGGLPFRLEKPAFARFGFPGEAPEAKPGT